MLQCWPLESSFGYQEFDPHFPLKKKGEKKQKNQHKKNQNTRKEFDS